MPEKLAKIAKPSVDRFREVRKLYCVPLLPQLHNAGLEDYKEKAVRYWNQVEEQIINLEKVGIIARIYHESIFLTGEDGLKAVKQFNESSYQLVKSKFENGAELVSLEDQELLNDYLDWSVCLSVVGRSLNVAQKVLEFQREATKKRDEHVIKRIDETLKKGEAGMLIMTDENRIRIQSNLPSDIQVFLVHPPAFGDFQRWLREFFSNSMQNVKPNSR